MTFLFLLCLPTGFPVCLLIQPAYICEAAFFLPGKSYFTVDQSRNSSINKVEMSPLFSISNPPSGVTRKKETIYKLDAKRREVKRVVDEVN